MAKLRVAAYECDECGTQVTVSALSTGYVIPKVTWFGDNVQQTAKQVFACGPVCLNGAINSALDAAEPIGVQDV